MQYFFYNETVISQLHHCVCVVDVDYNLCDLFLGAEVEIGEM